MRQPRIHTPPPARYFDCAPPDQAMYALGKLMPSSIHVRVDLERPLDAARLALAWRRLPEVHPLLGCSLAWPTLRPRWRPGAEPLALVEQTEQAPDHPRGPGPAELRLLNEALDVRRGPPARLALITREEGGAGRSGDGGRSTGGSDGPRQRLLLTVHHVAMDARSAVAVARALHGLYELLGRDPAPELIPDHRPRTLVEVLEQQGVTRGQQRRLALAQHRRERALDRSHHRDPRPLRGALRRPGPVTYREWLLEEAPLAALESRRRAAGWTLNDVRLGLIARSWGRALGAGSDRRQMSVWFATADARPWFAVQGGLGNLSALEPVGLDGVEQADAPGAVQIAHDAMALRKAGRLGLGAHVVGRWFRQLTPPGLFNAEFRAGMWAVSRLLRFNRAFTNIGALDDALGDWDGVVAPHVTVIAPLPHAPLTIITGSGFARRASLVVGFRQGWLTDAQLDAMHNGIRKDLATLGEEP